MGLTCRRLFIDNDGGIYRMSNAKFDRMIRSPASERVAFFAGQRIRSAEVLIETVDRKPIRVRHATFTIFQFDEQGRVDVTALVELVSFHAAVFVCAANIVFFCLAGHISDAYFFAVLFCVTAPVVAAYSAMTCAHSRDLWERVAPHGPAIVLLVGHLAPIAAVALFVEMNRAGVGSGLLYLPPILWALLFYPIGIAWTTFRITASTNGKGEFDS